MIPKSKSEPNTPRPKISTPTYVSHENHVGFDDLDKYKEKYNYHEFMENPSSLIRKYFKKSVENLFCAEGYYFHESVESYRSLKTVEERRNQALYMKETFFSKESQHEINISGKLKTPFFEKIQREEFDLDLFDDLDRDILKNLKIETYEKFLQSKEFQEFLKEQDGLRF
jgi:hypothetical protein